MNVRRASTISRLDPRADLVDAIHNGVDELHGLTPMFPSSARTSPSPSAQAPVTMMHSSSAGVAPPRTASVPSRVRTSAPAKRPDMACALALLREAAGEGDGRAGKALRVLAEAEKDPEEETPDVEGIKNALRKLIKNPDASERDRENARKALKDLGGDVIEDDQDENKKARSRAMGMRNRAEETTDDESGFERSKRELQKTIDDPDSLQEAKDAAQKALEVLEAYERRQQETDKPQKEADDKRKDMLDEAQRKGDESWQRQERRKEQEQLRQARAVYARLSADEKRVLAKLDAKPAVNKRPVQRGASLEMPTLTQAEARALADELERELGGRR